MSPLNRPPPYCDEVLAREDSVDHFQDPRRRDLARRILPSLYQPIPTVSFRWNVPASVHTYLELVSTGPGLDLHIQGRKRGMLAECEA